MSSEDERKGWVQGIAFAAGWLCSAVDEPSVAEDLINSSGLGREDFKKSEVAAYDLTQMRLSEKLKILLKGVRGQ